MVTYSYKCVLLRIITNYYYYWCLDKIHSKYYVSHHHKKLLCISISTTSAVPCTSGLTISVQNSCFWQSACFCLTSYGIICDQFKCSLIKYKNYNHILLHRSVHQHQHFLSNPHVSGKVMGSLQFPIKS